MNSTGNDIVALKATDKGRTGEYRFYSRILSASEQALYEQPAIADRLPFEHYTWLLWSIKESVFKYKSRNDPALKFSPTRIIVQQLQAPPVPSESSLSDSKSADIKWETAGSFDSGFYKGMLEDATGNFYSRSLIRGEVIVTSVSQKENFEDTWWGFRSIDDPGHANQSSKAREFVLDKLRSLFPSGHLHIGKAAAGFPTVISGDKEMNVPVSIAHHDRFVAYSFARPTI